MTINHGSLVEALNKYLRTMQAVATLDDPNLSDRGAFERRRASIEQAQQALTAALPPEPAQADRSGVLDALRPHTADDVAVQAREREKVEALIAAGRPLGGVIARADRARLAAIADSIETMPEVLESGSGDAIAAEVRDAVFDRLAVLGDTDAVRVAAQEADAAPAIAWRAIITETLDRGAPDYDGLGALHAVDPTVYGLVRDGIEQVDPVLIERTLKGVRFHQERGTY